MSEPSAPLRLVQVAVNRALALDPETLAGLGELAGRVLAVEVSGIGYRFYVRLGEAGVELTGDCAEPPDVSVSGSPVALARLLLVRGEPVSVSSAGLRVSGDVAILQRIQALAERLDIDWEEPLSRVVGDVAAHGIGNAVRGLQAFGRRVRTTLAQDLGEYLAEELRVVPARAEIDAYLSAVDVLRDDVERMEKRVQRLARTGRRP